MFDSQKKINIKGNLTSLKTPKIMGILNVTPDSFYDGGKHNTAIQAFDRAAKMIEEGADIIDIGGYSSRPGASEITVSEEVDRVVGVIEKICKEYPDVIISIDTFRAKVAEIAINSGASIINDISGGELDENMFDTAGKLAVPYIMMHMKGNPNTMMQSTKYDNLLKEILDYFVLKIEKLRIAGCKDIIIDPGFGFAKDLEQNYSLLSQLEYFKVLNLPILVGISRKSMIYKLLNATPGKVLNGTTILNTIAIQKGASILRVHDVKEARELITINNMLVNQ